jgi:flagellar biosynthetic protein FlhB
VFSTRALQPDFERINPAAGLKRLVSTRMLVEAAKSLLKLAALGALAYFAIKAFAIGHLGLGQGDPRGYAKLVVDAGITLVAWLLPALALIALADLLYTRRQYLERMRMSRRELREELKQREGDPRIRARIRELRREMLKRARALRRVKDADVLITNPTHLAVALAYRRAEMSAPSVVAKGAGELAARMAAAARRHGVPVVRNARLARGLFRATGVDEPIGPAHFADVARILAWVLARREPKGAA